ncbi:pentapeptide repeat-containing protein [Myxococcota bacterium]|nr:pentapeptide repeat-containing protein [Myxococcota bacterium]
MFVRRLDFASSWGMLQAFDLVQGDTPAPPAGRRDLSRPPPADDRMAIRRAEVHDRNLSGLSMPGWLVVRCQVDVTAFQDSDLSGAALVESTFDECDFSRAVLRDVDLRRSAFEGCTFDGADLRGADLRGCAFGGCSFDGADLRGATAHESQRSDLALDPDQAATVRWTTDPPPPLPPI